MGKNDKWMQFGGYGFCYECRPKFVEFLVGLFKAQNHTLLNPEEYERVTMKMPDGTIVDGVAKKEDI